MKPSFRMILVLLLIQQIARAQLCQGSLGDPVVKITFGNGPNPGPALPAGVTNYPYVSTDCPNDGFYAIRNSTANCFGNSWENVTRDHTGDPNGYFMLVNASIAPNDFFVDTVQGLCPGVTFEFAAYILNVMRPSACNSNGIKPNITFQIEKTDGTVLGTYNTGDIPSSNFGGYWQQFGFFFNNPLGVSSVVIRMRNNAPGGCGNDIALDDITFRPCGPNIHVFDANTNADSKSICYGQSYSLTLNSILSFGFNNPAYQWQKSLDGGVSWADIIGQTGTTYTTIIPAGTPVGPYEKFRLTISEQNNFGITACKVASQSFNVNITEFPIIHIIATNPICESGRLEMQGSDIYKCVWTRPSGQVDSTYDLIILNASQADAGKYYITATSDAGCSTTDSVTILVTPKIRAHARADTVFCEGGSVYLHGNGAGKYVWSPPDGLSDSTIANPLASPTKTTRYVLTLFAINYCTDTASVLIQVLKKPIANAGPDMQIFAGNTIQLQGDASGGQVNYFWTPNQFIDSSKILKPHAKPDQDIKYTLHVNSNNACGTATDDVFIRVYQNIKIPNAFSPNGDGINDVWKIDKIETYPNATVSVFDRYGQIVYEGYGFAKPWDGTSFGKPLPVGTYYFVIDSHSVLPKTTGWVLLLR